MTLDIFYIVLGLAGLFAGGEWLVRGAVSIADRLGIPPLIVGLTVVGFGTSAPELATSLQAALSGSPAIAVGNVVGSNMANLLLILGLSALLAPIDVHAKAFRRDGSVLIIATCLSVWVLLSGSVDRSAGMVAVMALLIYLISTILMERRAHESAAGAMYQGEADLMRPASTSLARSVLTLVVGLILVLVGARLLVSGAVDIAQLLGVSEAVIGLTVVAVGTSLPELATSLMAVRKGEGDIAFGNIIGSNLFNLLGIMGITALVHPLTVPEQIMRLDAWLMLLATFVVVLMAMTGKRVGRLEGGILFTAYLAYCILML